VPLRLAGDLDLALRSAEEVHLERLLTRPMPRTLLLVQLKDPLLRNNNNNLMLYSVQTVLQCFDTVGWAAGRASGL